MEIKIWTEVITIKHTKINIAIIITTLYVSWYVSNKNYRCLDNDDVHDELDGEENGPQSWKIGFALKNVYES